MSRLKCIITDASQNTFLQRYNPPPRVSCVDHLEGQHKE